VNGDGELQQTLNSHFELEGVGLHTGSLCRLRLSPAGAGEGVRFLLPGLKDSFPATVEYQTGANRCTTLGFQGQTVHTVEHLLSALAACGIDNCLIEVDGGEVPAVDGSALPFAHAIRKAGAQQQTLRREHIILEEPVWIEENGSTLIAFPSSKFRITCCIDFAHRVVGKQFFRVDVTAEAYEREIAPARTFGFLAEVEELRRQGLAGGGSLENALVIGDTGYLSPPRFDDEPVRHKTLDLIGDLALLGAPLQAEIVALKSSHRLNLLLARRILETRRE